MTDIGSTNPEDPIKKEEIEKRLNQRERATVAGVLQEQDIVKQKIDNCYEKLDRMTGLYGTLLGEVKLLREQYATIVGLRMNGGPTVVENGTND